MVRIRTIPIPANERDISSPLQRLFNLFSKWFINLLFKIFFSKLFCCCCLRQWLQQPTMNTHSPPPWIFSFSYCCDAILLMVVDRDHPYLYHHPEYTFFHFNFIFFAFSSTVRVIVLMWGCCCCCCYCWWLCCEGGCREWKKMKKVLHKLNSSEWNGKN